MYRKNKAQIIDFPIRTERRTLPSFLPQGMYVTLVTDDNGELLAFDGSSDENEVRELVDVATRRGFGVRVERDGEVISEQSSARSQIRRVANPRPPYDMGYGAPNALMLKSQLRSMYRIARRLDDALMDGDNLPQWVHTKVSTALDRLSTAANYLESKIERMNEGKRINPQYIENGEQMCATAWTLAVVLSPIKVKDLLTQAKQQGLNPEIVRAIVDVQTQDGEFATTGSPDDVQLEDTIVDVDFA